MALSDSVKFSLEEAESHLRNALSFAARQERPMVCTEIANMIKQIATMQHADDILDKLENREPGSSGLFGNFLDDED